MFDAGLILLFFGKIGRVIGSAHLAHIVRFLKIGIGIGTVKAAQAGGRKRATKGRAAVDAQQFTRCQHADKGRVAVQLAEIEPPGKAAQHAGRITLAKLFLNARTVVVFLEIIAHQVDAGIVGRFPAHRTADAEHVTAIDLGVVEQIVREAVALQVEAGDAHAETVGDRQVDHALHADRIVIAVIGFGRDTQLVEVRLGGDEVDDARGGVATEQRALWAAQHFDALHIEKFGFEQAGGDQRAAVDVNGGGAVAGHADAQIADAADGEAGAGEIALGKGDVGQGKLKIRAVLDLLPLQRFGTESRNGDRHIL